MHVFFTLLMIASASEAYLIARGSRQLFSTKLQAYQTIDGYKEESRSYRDKGSSFNSEAQWRRHRSSRRYFKAIYTGPSSGVLRGLLLEALVVFAAALGVCAWNHLGVDIGAGKWGPVSGLGFTGEFILKHRAELNPLLLQLTSPALGLLLVFRTNSAYARWWEARTIWGGVVNKSRDIARHALIWFDRTEGDEATANYIQEVCAFSVALMHHLRLPEMKNDGSEEYMKSTAAARESLAADLRNLNLPDDTIAQISSSDHAPLEVIRRLSRGTRCNAKEAAKAYNHVGTSANSVNGYGGAGERVSDSVVRALDKNISELIDLLGACERIVKTPMPLVYTRHTERFLSMWLFAVPFTIAYNMVGSDFVIIVGTVFISLFFLGIDELGIQIEEPFSVLPLTTLCDGIASSTASMLEGERGAHHHL